MINTSHLCMECMKDKAEAEVCPHCGYREEALQTAPYLPLRSWLMDRYLVGKMLTCDGEGVTYIGWDNILQAPVTVREYLPDGLCERASDGLTVRGLAEDYSRCLAGFLSRARALARMRDLAALFPTYDIFELNGTAYAVSEYTESISLGEFLHRNGEALTFEQTRALMLPAVSTLSALHEAGLIHGGIAPETLFVGRDGRLRFGGFAQPELRAARGALKPQLFPGYAAIEQYGFDGKIGPHTDVYGFAALVYRVLTGQAPTDAKTRVGNDLFVLPASLQNKIPAYAADALTNALQLMPDARTATAERFREEFTAAPNVTEEKYARLEDEEAEESNELQSGRKKRGRGLLYTVIAMLVTLVVLGGLFAFLDLRWHLFGVLGNDTTSSTPSILVISSEETPSVNTSSQLTRKVDTFVGQSLAACERNYGSYTFKVKYKIYTEEYAKGVIVSQSPEAGTEFPLENDEVQEITVVVSLGSGQLRVPQVEGLTYAEAMERLWEAGFAYESVTNNTGNPAYNGIVTKISPSAGSTCNVYDAKIVLYVEDPVTSEPLISEPPSGNKEVESVADTPSSR